MPNADEMTTIEGWGTSGSNLKTLKTLASDIKEMTTYDKRIGL